MIEYFTAHWLDICSTILGLAYILLEYKASVWMWVVGFVMQLMGAVLYYQHGLYADSAMELYYIGMTIYGFYSWKQVRGQKSERPITRISKDKLFKAMGVALSAWLVIWIILSQFTPSQVPIADSFTTAFSIIGIWALARKYLEQWFIWIVVDVVTCALYFYKGIPFKASLYALYVIIAIAGYFRWRKLCMQDNK